MKGNNAVADPCGPAVYGVCLRVTRWLGCFGPIPAVCWVCCMLSGTGLCDRPIPHPEEFYRVGVSVCVCVCVCVCLFEYNQRQQ